MAKKVEKRNEFRRTNLKDGRNHPTYIFAREGNKLRYIGITHSKITKDVENIRLDKNPDPKDNEPAYLRPIVQKAHRASFGAKLKGWFFSDSDLEKVEQIKKGNKKDTKKDSKKK